MILLKTSLLKLNSSMYKLLFYFAATTRNYDSLSLWILQKSSFTIERAADSCNVLNYERAPRQIKNI